MLIHPVVCLLAFAIIFIASLTLAPKLDLAFFPRTDAGQFMLNVKAPSGTRIGVTEQEIAKLEALIRQEVSPADLGMIVSTMQIEADGRGLVGMEASREIRHAIGAAQLDRHGRGIHSGHDGMVGGIGGVNVHDPGQIIVEKVGHRRERVAAHPQAGRAVPERSDPSLREVTEKRYRIVYRVGDDGVIVVNVFEGHKLLRDAAG